MNIKPVKSLFLLLAPLAFAPMLAACGQADSAASAPDTIAAASGASASLAAAPAVEDANRVAAQIADTLQACSYDGTPVRFGLGGQAPRDCREMIEQVMHFTGLPQNFIVTQADVPNAAAIILLDKQKLPQRVIAFNPNFIELVRRATGGNPWSAVSIMAHEVGHHLAGHTIQPGGSQPPIELEADKFSGFVLYKMGASLDDAAKALNTLVPAQAPAGSTHPARSQRVAALADGWSQACRQTARTDCDSGTPGSAPAPGVAAQIAQTQSPVSSAPAAPAPLPQPQPQPQPQPRASAGGTLAPAAAAAAVILPAPDPKALPSKGTQFIYDEFGILDPAIVAAFEKQMYEHARQWGVEIVTMLVKDLHGMSAEEYGWAMMRQLRVGKLDVGNGAVLVVAPEQGQAAAVMGPGVQLEMGSHDKSAQLTRWIGLGWPLCRKKNACGNWTESLLLAADHIRRDTDELDWTVRWQSLGEIQHQAAAENGQGISPQQSRWVGKLVRFAGTVVDVSPSPGDKSAWVNESMLRDGRRKAVHVRSEEGLTAMLYLDPGTETLMPAGALRAGTRYAFIGRANGLSWNPRDTQEIDLLSYDLLP